MQNSYGEEENSTREEGRRDVDRVGSEVKGELNGSGKYIWHLGKVFLCQMIG